MGDPVKVLLADDEKSIRVLLRMALKDTPDVSIVAEASNGVEAVRLAQDLRPDVILLDLNMPEMDGIRATVQIRRVHPAGRVIVLTAYEDHILRRDAFRCGAWCYLVKGESSLADLVAILRTAGGEAENPETPYGWANYWRRWLSVEERAPEVRCA